MESRAKIRGRSIHPMLVAFPVALYVTTLVAYIVHATTHSQIAWQIGLTSNVLAVAAALVTAIPGFVDLYALSERDRARPTALVHMSLSLTALGLFATNLVVQCGAVWDKLPIALRSGIHLSHVWKPDVVLGLALSGLGVGVTVIAGIFGWTLVHTHRLGLQASDEIMSARLDAHVPPVVVPPVEVRPV